MTDFIHDVVRYTNPDHLSHRLRSTTVMSIEMNRKASNVEDDSMPWRRRDSDFSQMKHTSVDSTGTNYTPRCCLVTKVSPEAPFHYNRPNKEHQSGTPSLLVASPYHSHSGLCRDYLSCAAQQTSTGVLGTHDFIDTINISVSLCGLCIYIARVYYQKGNYRIVNQFYRIYNILSG